MKYFMFIFFSFFLIGCQTQVAQQPIPTVPQNTTQEVAPTSTPTITMPQPYYGNLTVYFINVGQGDSIFVLAPNNHTMLIDCGKSDKGTEIVSFIRNLGFNKISILVTTHPDADHIGGCAYVMQKLNPDIVYDNGLQKDTNTYREYLVQIKNHQLVATDSLFDFNDIYSQFIVGYDSIGFSNDDNDNSVLVKLQYNKIKFLFTGDCEEDCEDRISDSDLSSTILKVAHHGSKSSSSMVFLNKVNPEVSIISVGENSYGHPSHEVIDRLFYKNSKVYRTDIDGHIIITTDGINYNLLKVR